MRKVEFKFDIGQKVKTILGATGIISMLGIDDGGKKYFVQTANNDQWFKEAQLSAEV